MNDGNANATILIIEDEPPIVRFLRTALGGHGYTFHEAPTGQEGLAQAASCRISCCWTSACRTWTGSR